MKQYRAREKITQKMTREGAVEVNAATGRKKRISNRIRDADLTKSDAAPKLPEQDAQAAQDAAAQPAPISSGTSPLPHAPELSHRHDTAAAERVMERIDAAHTRKASKKAVRKAQEEATAQTKSSRLQFTEEEIGAGCAAASCAACASCSGSFGAASLFVRSASLMQMCIRDRPFVDRFPKDTELYKVMTTKPEEVGEA